jgi:hypothetical protein
MAITLKNINASSASDVGDVFWGLISSGYVEGTSGAIANGGDSGMGRFQAASDITTTIPPLPNVNLDSDGGVDGAVKGQPDAPPTAVITGGVIDQIIAAAASNLLIKAEGPHDYIGGSQICLTHNPMCFVINRPGAIRDSGADFGQIGWEVTEIWNSLADVKQFNQVGRGVQGQQIVELVFNHVGQTVWGETIASADFGVTRLWGLKPYWSEKPVYYHTFKGDGAATTFTLDETPHSADGDSLQYWLNGVKQTYTTNYSVVTATKVVTFVVAPAAGERAVFKVLYDKAC